MHFEMFRRMLSGEQLSAREIEAIRNDNDHGTITVDGKKVDVEFWFGEDIADAFGDAAEAVGSAASDVVDYVGTAAKEAAYEIGDGIKEVTMGVVNAGEIFVKGFTDDVLGGFFVNVLNGRFADAFDSVINGIDKMAFQTTRRLLSTCVMITGHHPISLGMPCAMCSIPNYVAHAKWLGKEMISLSPPPHRTMCTRKIPQ